MSFIAELLGSTVAPRINAELPRHVSGLGGFLIRGYLPQTWWFSSESGAGTIYVDQQGICQAIEGHVGAPDVTISWTDQAFHAALALQDRTKLPPGTMAPTIQTLTSKGRTAFNFLRNRFGL
jgi:hypothetical protein